MAPAIISNVVANEEVNGKSAAGDVDRSVKQLLKTPLPNPSLQVTADHKLKQKDAEVYAPGRGEVLLHIKATGVCGYGCSQTQTFPR